MTIPAVARPAVKIPTDIANLIADYAHGEAKIPHLAFAPVTNVNGQATESSSLSGALEIVGAGDARVVVENFFANAGKLGEKVTHIELEDNSIVSSKRAFITRCTTFHSAGPDRHSVEIQLSEWYWSTPEVPIAWVGILHGPDFNSSNLCIQGYQTSSHKSLRLEGNAVWHLVCKGAFGNRTCLAIVTTPSGDCREPSLWPDFAALEFIFGTPLRLDVLVGVDKGNAPVAAFGPSFGYRFRLKAMRCSPVPDDHRDTWMAVAFPKVVRALGEKGPIRTAVCGYVDSTIGHLDGQYLFAQVALEALASRLTTDKKPLVRNVEDWRNWAKSVRGTLKELAVDDDDGRALNTLAKKLKNLCVPTTSSLVKQTLNRLGIEPPAEALDEIDGRDAVVHTMSMTLGKAYDIERELRRIRTIRTLIASIVLRHVGYEGGLAGWDLDDSNWPLEADWFAVSEGAKLESRVVYDAIHSNWGSEDL